MTLRHRAGALAAMLMLLVGALFGVTTFPDLAPARWALLGQAILAAFIPNFIKNLKILS